MALKADPKTPQIARKAATIDEIKEKFEGADAAVLTEYRGLSVTDIASLRDVLRPIGTEYKVYKNTLVQRAANEVGVGEQIGGMLSGPVAIAFVRGDAAAAAKALREFAKSNQSLVLKGGILGTNPIGPADVEELAELPSRDVLLSQIAGLFEAPLAQTAGVLVALLRDTVGLVQALADKRIAGGEAAPAAEEAPAEAPATEVAEAPVAEAAVAEAAVEAPAEAPAEEPAVLDTPEVTEAPAEETAE